MGATIALSLVSSTSSIADTGVDYDLALHWAPVHHQDVDATDAKSDFITRIDYDGDWITHNNWEHLDGVDAALDAHAYYSVSATSTHWFILYGFYHPRDWSDGFEPGCIDSHENDMEGVLLTVRRDGSDYGHLEAVITVAHHDFYSYVSNISDYKPGSETVDGGVVFQADGKPGTLPRLGTFAESESHAIHAWDGSGFPGGDGITYWPATADHPWADTPIGANDPLVHYKLVNMQDASELWSRRLEKGTFYKFGTFRGDNCTNNAAQAPWGWDDTDDNVPRGAMALDPARLVDSYFSNKGSFSLEYTQNGYH
ncbi:hypothetical protein ACFYW6_39840 [Streptomyces sp. NPDC002659]|uniref:hypothetical protein n=1 Tax=Streptomyces sp. NPDC002659 TaxID=3364656 RepID=UPI0036C6188A